MSWTHDELTKLGYHRHPDGNYYSYPASRRVLDSVPQHDPVQPLDSPKQTQAKGKSRTTLRITRVSCKLQDFDNFVGGTKPLTDQLRYAQLIPDDDPSSIDAHYTQEKCRHKKGEKTIVEITYHT